MRRRDSSSSASGGVGGRKVRIAGTGSYLPARVLSNKDLEKMVDTSDEWIFTRTGIKERHIGRGDESVSDMAAVAALRSLESAQVSPEKVDMIVLATITPDMPMPNTAGFVQKAIGARKSFCFDLEAACSGFLYAMQTAKEFIRSGSVDTALVIGAEKLSSVTDWQDRTTCVLFGDGAGAAVLKACEDNTRGIIGSVLHSDGALSDLLTIPGGGSRNPASADSINSRLHYVKMNGREVFKHAVRAMSDAALEVLDLSGVPIQEVDWIIPHQANMRIIQAIAERLDVPLAKVYCNLERCGNMSAASVPVAFDEAVRSNVVKRGDVVLMVAFGGGFTWGATLLEW